MKNGPNDSVRCKFAQDMRHSDIAVRYLVWSWFIRSKANNIRIIRQWILLCLNIHSLRNYQSDFEMCAHFSMEHTYTQSIHCKHLNVLICLYVQWIRVHWYVFGLWAKRFRQNVWKTGTLLCGQLSCVSQYHWMVVSMNMMSGIEKESEKFKS